MSKIPPMDETVNHAPQVVLLGAGASIDSYYHWDQTGNPLPSKQGLIETLELKDDIENSGFKTVGLNFEAFYDDISSAGTKLDEIGSCI